MLQSQFKELATCTIVVYTHSDQHLIPDPSTVIPIPVANGSGISRKVLAFRIGRFLFPTDPRSDALDCCRVLHRIRDQLLSCAGGGEFSLQKLASFHFTIPCPKHRDLYYSGLISVPQRSTSWSQIHWDRTNNKWKTTHICSHHPDII